MYISLYVNVNTFIGGRQPQNKLMRLRTFKKKCMCAQCISNTTRVCLKALQKHFFLLTPAEPLRAVFTMGR